MGWQRRAGGAQGGLGGTVEAEDLGGRQEAREAGRMGPPRIPFY